MMMMMIDDATVNFRFRTARAELKSLKARSPHFRLYVYVYIYIYCSGAPVLSVGSKQRVRDTRERGYSQV